MLYWLYFLVIVSLAASIHHYSGYYDAYHSMLIATVFVFSVSLSFQYLIGEYHGERDLFGLPHGTGKWKAKDHHQFKGRFVHGKILEGTHYFKDFVSLSKERERAHRRSSSASIAHNAVINGNASTERDGGSLSNEDHDDVEIMMEYNYEGEFLDGVMNGKGRYSVSCSRPVNGSPQRMSSQGRRSSTRSSSTGGREESSRRNSRAISRGSLSDTMLKHKCYSFEGTFENGLMMEGTMTFRDGSSYTGTWLKQYNHHFIPGKEKASEEHTFGDSSFMDRYKTVSVVLKSAGNGKLTYPDGTVYMGAWNEEGRYHDKHGKLKYPPALEESDTSSSPSSSPSQFKQQSSPGISKSEDKKFNLYTGSFVHGLKHGGGELIMATGDMYMGSFYNELYEGTGTALDNDGNSYTGDWKEGLRHGNGKMKFKSGNMYVGQFKANEFCGQGCLTLKDGSIYHEGIFPHNKPQNRRRSFA